ncbi:MAG: 6-pyruvoyl-tetrahydropterin synthase-related protein, partial [Patescibacteria group bacterium]
MLVTKDKVNYFIIFIISLILVLDLFLHKGAPATFDGNTHMTAMAQFSLALKSGDFPVLWAPNFANYGLPIALIAHQIPNYLGAIISFFIHDFVLVFNLLMFFAVLLAGAFFYRFLRLYFSEAVALLGTIVFTFAPYKIINIYIRGALPEMIASIFVPLILINIHTFIKTKSIGSISRLVLFFTLLVLTHPFLFVIELFIIVPYFIFELLQSSSAGKDR